MKKNIGFGVMIILLAVLLILSQFGYVNGMGFGRLVISVVLLWVFVTSLFKLKFFGVFISLAIAILMYNTELGLPKLEAGPIIFAAVLLSIGFSAIFGRFTNRYYHYHSYYKNDNYSNNQDKYRDYVYEQSDGYHSNNQHEHYEDYVKDPIEDDEIRYRTSFSSATRFVKSKNFVKADFVNELGALNIYLDQVELSENGAVVNVYCRLGSVKLFIPREFNLINKVDVTLGNVNAPYFEVANKDIDNTITLTGNVTLGDINIVRI